MRLILDYETRSELDLRQVGAIKYAKHSSTELMCTGYKIENEKSRIWLPGQKMPSDFKEAIHDPSFQIVCHNSLFEYCVTHWVARRSYRLPELPVSRYKCTQAKAAAHAIPHALEKAGEALKLKMRKDMDGSRLVKKHMKPRPNWKKTGQGPKWFEDELERLAIYEYCRTDCDVEKLLDDSLPDLSPAEQKVWEINQEMNLRGIQIDIDSVKKIIAMIKVETKFLNEEVFTVTNGEIKSVLQTEVLTKWLQANQIETNDVTAASIAKALKQENLKPHVKRVLEVRQQIAKASVKKYHKMIARADEDGKARDVAKFHGASTGREAAQGIQVHNLPSRGLIKTTDHAIKLIQADDFETLKLLYANPFRVFSSTIRSVITASPGKELFAGDFNAIECRILCWLSNNEETLNDFKNGIDPYVKMAAKVLGKKISDIDSNERQFGKVIVLASGYQMGPDKFLQTCEDWGVKGITKAMAKKAITMYRELNQPVVNMWSNLERAAIKAVTDKVRVTVHKTTWYVEGKFLYCQLPSGRRIAYYGPRVKNEPTPWGAMAPKLYYWRSKGKAWFETATYGGKLTENICQSVARDITVNATQKVQVKNFDYLFQVHDELICENDKGKFTTQEYEKLMVQLPEWAKGLPVVAGAWKGHRYRK